MGAAASLFVDVRANVSNATSALKKTEAQFMATGAAAKKMDAQVGATAATHNKAAKSSQNMAKASQGARGAMQGMGAGFTPIQAGAIAAGYALGKTIQVTSKFDGAMRNVNSIARLSEGEFKGLSNSVLEMARSTAQSPQTLAEGMYQLVSSGFSAGEALTVMKSSAVAATAGLTDAETATTAVAGVLNAYKLTAKDAAQVSDDLFQTVDKGVISFGDLAQGIGPVLPFASKLGVNIKQVGAMIASLTKEGVPAAEAMTYTKGAMAQLIKPTTDLKRQYKELGVASGAELISKTGSFQEALEALYVSTGRNTQAFAKLFPDLRGMTAAFQVTGAGAKGAQRMLGEFADTAGRTNEVFKEQSKSTPIKWKQTAADVQATAIKYGRELAPALNVAATGMSKLATAAGSNTGMKIVKWATPIGALGTAAKGASAAANALKNAGRGAGAGGVKTSNISFKVKGDSEALAKSKKVRSGLMAIPSIRNIAIKVKSDADVVSRKTRTALMRNGRPIEIKTKLTRAGNASTVVAPKAVKITADNSDVRAKAAEAKGFVESVNGLRAKPKITADASGAQAGANAAKQAIAAVNGKTVIINVQYKAGPKPKGLASGGRVSTALSEVNERGPESITGPGGQTAMLGDGKRQIMPLPIGWHVNTAGDTARMGIGSYAKGGKVGKKARERKRKLMDKRDSKIQRGLDTVDYYTEMGKYGTDRQIKELEKLAKIKGRSGARRSVRTQLHGLKSTQRSNVKDLEDQAAAVGKSPEEAARIALGTANRHLAAATKSKDKEKIAQAQLEVAEANNELLEAQKAAQEAQVEAMKAQAEALKAVADELKRQNNMAESNKGITKNTLRSALADLTNDDLGGIFGQRFQTGSRRTSAYVSR